MFLTPVLEVPTTEEAMQSGGFHPGSKLADKLFIGHMHTCKQGGRCSQYSASVVLLLKTLQLLLLCFHLCYFIWKDLVISPYFTHLLHPLPSLPCCFLFPQVDPLPAFQPTFLGWSYALSKNNPKVTLGGEQGTMEVIGQRTVTSTGRARWDQFRNALVKHKDQNAESH